MCLIMMGMKIFYKLAFFSCLTACVAGAPHMPDDFVRRDIQGGEYTLLTMQRISSDDGPVHIYIEGDGRAFNSRGMPTRNPTPHNSPVQRWAQMDAAPNVAYIARPCQYIMGANCATSDWTTGRFSPDVLESVTDAVRQIAGTRPVVLIGYSGGALLSGLIIQNAPDINVIKWVTVAGVLNHADWTEYFGDTPLSKSMDLLSLPDVPQTHYVAENDAVVPLGLTQRWVRADDIVSIPGVNHVMK